MMRQPDNQLILIHSVGRCGSTLLSTVFNNLPDVRSLSEPEAFTAIVKRREPDGRNEAEMAQLLDAVLQVQCRPTNQLAPNAYCDLPTMPERIAQGVNAFERDSQQGSSLARKNLKQDDQNQLTTEYLQEIHQLLAEHTTIHTADFIVPGTIQL